MKAFFLFLSGLIVGFFPFLMGKIPVVGPKLTSLMMYNKYTHYGVKILFGLAGGFLVIKGLKGAFDKGMSIWAKRVPVSNNKIVTLADGTTVQIQQNEVTAKEAKAKRLVNKEIARAAEPIIKARAKARGIRFPIFGSGKLFDTVKFYNTYEYLLTPEDLVHLYGF